MKIGFFPLYKIIQLIKSEKYRKSQFEKIHKYTFTVIALDSLQGNRLPSGVAIITQTKPIMPMSGTVMLSPAEMVWQESWVVHVEREEFHKGPLCSWPQDEHNWRGVAEHTPEDTQQIQTKDPGKEWGGCKKKSGSWNKMHGWSRGYQGYHSIREHERKNVCGGLCLGCGIGHTWVKEKTWNSLQNRKLSLEGLQIIQKAGLALFTAMRHSASCLGENPYQVADFRCDLQLKCVNPGPEVVSFSFWKCCNGKVIEAVISTQKTPSGWTKTWKTDFISRSESKLKCDIEQDIPPISASFSPYIKWA